MITFWEQMMKLSAEMITNLNHSYSKWAAFSKEEQVWKVSADLQEVGSQHN